MSKKLFAILLGLTAVAGLLLLLQPQKSQDDGGFDQTVLLPELAAAVNDLDWVQIVSAGDQTVATLQRKDHGWVVDEASAYAADWERLRSALAALAQAEKREPKTSNPDYYERLGVEDIDAEDAQGVMVRFSDDSGVPAVIIGNVAQGRSGQYARLQGSKESFLLDREIDISTTREEWLERVFIDIAESEVVDVSITHADGESVQLSKVSAEDADFSLQGIPEGKQIKSAWTVNSLAGGLSALELDDVMPRPRIGSGDGGQLSCAYS